ncbi:MAG: response regulator [Candidatus Pacebacteria bacterium]|nr:response regulator [Candidatus Paceibacterota bacterium]
MLVDINMPGRDGLSTTREMLSIHRAASGTGDGGRLAVIGLTGDAGERLRDKCRSAGMIDVLQKPCGRAVLTQALKSNHIGLLESA